MSGKDRFLDEMSFEMRQNPEHKAIFVARGPSGARPEPVRGSCCRRYKAAAPAGGVGGDVIGYILGR